MGGGAAEVARLEDLEEEHLARARPERGRHGLADGRAHRLRSLGGGGARRRTGPRRADPVGPSRAAPPEPRPRRSARWRTATGASPHSASTAASWAPSVPPGPVSTMWHCVTPSPRSTSSSGTCWAPSEALNASAPGYSGSIGRYRKRGLATPLSASPAAPSSPWTAASSLSVRALRQITAVPPSVMPRACSIHGTSMGSSVDRALVVRGGDDHEAHGVVALAHDPHVVGGLVEEAGGGRPPGAQVVRPQPCGDGRAVPLAGPVDDEAAGRVPTDAPAHRRVAEHHRQVEGEARPGRERLAVRVDGEASANVPVEIRVRVGDHPAQGVGDRARAT